VFEVTGKNPLIDIALELERIALGRLLRLSQALSERRLLSGIIYQAMGFR
jgi:citrate synthase